MENNNRRAKILTYMAALQNGDIKGNQMEILDFIYRNSGANVRDICKELCMPHQTVTARVSDLMDSGMVKEIGQDKIDDSYFTKLQFVPDSEEQDMLSDKRRREKFTAWVKKGIKEYEDLMTFTLKQELNNN